jgi:hypothetical protein
MSTSKPLTSRTHMRRMVAKAGGYFSRQARKWVLAGRSSNLVGSPHWPTEWYDTLEEAYAACDGMAERRIAADQWDEAECRYLRSAR